jgi:transcriptional regulator with XRE-family HTH domain
METTTEIRTAARTLRARQQISQQMMAGVLGLSMGAIRNYEAGAVPAPEPRPLYAYLSTAASAGERELAAVFRRAFYEAMHITDAWDAQLEIEPVNEMERLLVAATLAACRSLTGFEEFREPVVKTLEEPSRQLVSKLRLHQNPKVWVTRGKCFACWFRRKSTWADLVDWTALVRESKKKPDEDQ